MSYVTNIIVSFGVLENEDDRLADLNRYLDGDSHTHNPSKLVMTSSVHDAYGGTKVMERPTALGAYNYLNLDEFLSHVRKIAWEYPSEVQVFVCGQHEDLYTERFQEPRP